MKTGVGVYAENLRRLLTLAGQEGEPAELAPELMGVFVLESNQPEWAYLRGERLASVFGSLAGVALNRSAISLSNPVNSGVLIIVEEICGIILVVDDAPTIRRDVALGGALTVPGRPRDLRHGGVATGVVQTNNTLTDAALGGNALGIPSTTAVSAARTYVLDRRAYVIPPGRSLALVSGGDNEAMTATFVWRERALRKYEL